MNKIAQHMTIEGSYRTSLLEAKLKTFGRQKIRVNSCKSMRRFMYLQCTAENSYSSHPRKPNVLMNRYEKITPT